MKVVIVHGASGSPDENWFMWLKSELEKHNIDSAVPELPIDETQSYESWNTIIDPLIETGDIAIGHSLGGLFWLNYIKQTNKKLKELYLVATPNPLLDKFNPGNDDIFRNIIITFSALEQSKAGDVLVFESNNDPYIPQGTGEEIADMLEGEYDHVPQAGHFNTDSGYDTFPQLLEQIIENNL